MATKLVLIGSGLAGGLLAAYLGRQGYEVDLSERRSDPRVDNFVGGRSINLALSTRGIYALEQLGIADQVLRHAIPMRGRMIHPAGTAATLHFAPYERDPNKYINSIGRATLNTVVIEAAKRYPNVRVHFNHRCTDVDLDTATAQLLRTGTDTDGRPALLLARPAVMEARADALIRVDGAFSTVGRAVEGRLDRFAISRSYPVSASSGLTI